MDTKEFYVSVACDRNAVMDVVRRWVDGPRVDGGALVARREELRRVRELQRRRDILVRYEGEVAAWRVPQTFHQVKPTARTSMSDHSGRSASDAADSN